MTPQELFARSGLEGPYEAWAFGGDPDELAALVVSGVKTATCSAHALYAADDEPLPQEGDYSVILNSRGEAVCIIRTTRVYLAPYCDVTPEHAFREGEGDRTLAYWRDVHERFFTGEMRAAGMAFDENMLLVCEEFELIATA